MCEDAHDDDMRRMIRSVLRAANIPGQVFLSRLRCLRTPSTEILDASCRFLYAIVTPVVSARCSRSLMSQSLESQPKAFKLYRPKRFSWLSMKSKYLPNATPQLGGQSLFARASMAKLLLFRRVLVLVTVLCTQRCGYS